MISLIAFFQRFALLNGFIYQNKQKKGKLSESIFMLTHTFPFQQWHVKN